MSLGGGYVGARKLAKAPGRHTDAKAREVCTRIVYVLIAESLIIPSELEKSSIL
jgi:hypothetical protein